MSFLPFPNRVPFVSIAHKPINGCKQLDELDSHLYQSVGTHLLPLLAESMSLPLYTKVIRGKAISQGAEYGSRLRLGAGTGQKGDETEDLTCLLSDVLEAHPEATALSSGAILSTYQRLRIEHVCGRLGLTSLSFLWQSEQSRLLDRMLGSGVEAVIMKVAGVGLGVGVVGKQLGQIRPLLAKLEAQYGSHPAGEGGEYETLTLSTPLFSHRLKLVKTETVVTDPEPYTVAYLKVEEAVLEPKEGWVKPTVEELRGMLGLDEEGEEQVGVEGLDEEGKERLEELGEREMEDVRKEGGGVELVEWSAGGVGVGVGGGEVQFVKKKRWFTASVQGVSLPSEDVGQELEKCFNAISCKSSSISQFHPFLAKTAPSQTAIGKPLPPPPLDSHYPPPLLHVSLPPRERKVQDVFRYEPSLPRDCCCAPFVWEGARRGHRV